MKLTSARIVYQIPQAEEIGIQKNISYKRTAGRDFHMDVYRPPNLSKDVELPVVIFIHGDGPSLILKNAKEWGIFRSYGELIAASGSIAITFNHRSSEDFTNLNEAGTDVDDLIHFVRGKAHSLQIDKNRIALWAFSAGVPYGLKSAMQDRPDYIRCIVAYYGYLNLLHLRNEIPAKIPDSTRKAFSLISYLSDYEAPPAPMLVVSAEFDSHPRINESINHFKDEAARRNVKIEHLHHASGQHGFDIIDDNKTSREIIGTTLNFLKKHLAKNYKTGIVN